MRRLIIWLTYFGVLLTVGLTISFTVSRPAISVAATPTPPPTYSYLIVNTYPHDPGAFTQGLIYQDDIFYEGTGLRGRSSLRKVDPTTGHVLKQVNLSDQYFGEGITIWEDRLIQLTWQSGTGLVYDKDSFEPLETFTYPTEGWGITHDGQKLIMSDGTARLYFWDSDTLAEIGHLDVYDHRGPVDQLNELEYINGEIYANIWRTNQIARIDPQTGHVIGWIDLTGILQLPANYNQPVDVLNGIAYDPATERLFVTGKLWPSLFEIELVPPIPATPSPDLTRELTAFYPFSGSAEDVSGQNNHAIVQGATLTIDRFGRPHQAYQFDGENDYLEIPDAASLDMAEQLSVSVWLYYEPPAEQGYYTILEKSEPTEGLAHYGLWLIEERLEFCVQPQAGVFDQVGWCLGSPDSLSLATSQWYHVVGTYEGGTTQLYVNNELVAQRSDSRKQLAVNDSPIFIGADPTDPHQPAVRYFRGILDDLRLYERAITAAEIELLYHQVQIYLPIILK